LRALTRGALIGLGALILTAASSWIERFGPDQAVYCALGKSSDGHEIWCPEPVLNGGWPAPFLYDRPGISVERQLSVFEDDFRAGPFFADFGCFALILLLLSQAAQKLRSPSADRRINPNSSPF
jgi:hypothetical protein